MDKIPFSVYDVFGYVAPGLLLLVTADFILGSHWIVGGDVGIGAGVFWAVVALIVGQVLATPSSAVIEFWFVRGVLGAPSNTLFANQGIDDWRHQLFPGYYAALPSWMQQQVREKAKQRGVAGTGEDLFHLAYADVPKRAGLRERLDIWVTRYGFCRNVCFTCMLGTLAIPLLCWIAGDWRNLWLMAVALVVAVGMFYRYLRFHRQYSFELFQAFASD